jgi:hypothetical protein
VPAFDASEMTLRLRQGQLWKQGNQYLRIVQLERLEVGYKSLPHPTSKEGTIHRISKKDFCRLLKSAELVTAENQPSSPLASPRHRSPIS